jgi:GSH-dependent disulfide-bond oxidoreductase
MMDFYTNAGPVPAAQRVAIMLEECGLTFTSHEIEVGAGAKKPAGFLKINPLGSIPVLVDKSVPGKGPVTIVQGGAIILYLADKTGKFLPRELDGRAIAYRWFMCALTDLQPTSMMIYHAESSTPQRVAPLVKFFEDSYIDICKLFDRRLADASYLGGDEYGIADMALITSVNYRRLLIENAGGLVHLRRWMEEVCSRPVVKRVLTQSIS